MSARAEAELREHVRAFYEGVKERLPAGVTCAVVFAREERGGSTIVVGGEESLAEQIETCLESMAEAVAELDKKPGPRRGRRA